MYVCMYVQTFPYIWMYVLGANKEDGAKPTPVSLAESAWTLDIQNTVCTKQKQKKQHKE